MFKRLKKEREAIKAIKQAQKQAEKKKKERELEKEAKRLASELGVSVEYAKIYLKKQKRKEKVKKRLKETGKELGKKAWEFLEPVEEKPEKSSKKPKTELEQGFDFSSLLGGSFGQSKQPQGVKKKQGSKKTGEDLFKMLGKW